MVRIEDDHDHTFVNSLAKKYINQDVYMDDQPGAERVIVTVDPEHITKLE